MTLEIENGVVIVIDALGVSKYTQASQFLDFICEMKKMKIRAQYVWNKWKDKFGLVDVILPDPKITIFQDSIVICFPDRVEKENTLNNLFASQNWLMAAYVVALEKGLFFRGAISYGEYVYCESKGYLAILGKPVVDAFNDEKKTEWIGVIQTEAFRKQYEESLEKFANTQGRDLKDIRQEYDRFHVKYNVPLKDGQKPNYYVINWPTIWNKIGIDILKTILIGSCRLADKKDRPKYKNTLDFVKYCEDNQFFMQ